MARVSVKGLWKEYGGHVVLENINLEVRDHEFVTIVGASGCGKTTFLKMLLGSEQPSRGQLLIDDQPVPPEPGPDRGIVFQRYSLFPHLTVEQNLMLGLELQGAPVLGKLFGAKRRAAREKAEKLLETLGLAHARNKYPPQLSGGMQQRLSIGQSVIREPRILLLDEPFGALDPGITADMHRLIVELWAANAMTIFMITHDVQESFKLGTRLLVFDTLRHDPQAPERYGARVTYDIPLRGPAVKQPSRASELAPISSVSTREPDVYRANVDGVPAAPPA
jgi:NitT/TauT family transport system ATP-binding protein